MYTESHTKYIKIQQFSSRSHKTQFYQLFPTQSTEIPIFPILILLPPIQTSPPGLRSRSAKHPNSGQAHTKNAETHPKCVSKEYHLLYVKTTNKIKQLLLLPNNKLDNHSTSRLTLCHVFKQGGVQFWGVLTNRVGALGRPWSHVPYRWSCLRRWW